MRRLLRKPLERNMPLFLYQNCNSVDPSFGIAGIPLIIHIATGRPFFVNPIYERLQIYKWLTDNAACCPQMNLFDLEFLKRLLCQIGNAFNRKLHCKCFCCRAFYFSFVARIIHVPKNPCSPVAGNEQIGFLFTRA